MTATSALQIDSFPSTDGQSSEPLGSSTAAVPIGVTDQVVRRESAVRDLLRSLDPGNEEARFDTALHSLHVVSTLPNRDRTVESSTIRVPQTLLAEWNGCVLAIEDHYFSAALKGIYGEGVRNEQEDAEIPVSDVGESDRELLRPGNLFRLCVFYEIQENGQPRRYTQVIFRRLPAYRSQDLVKAAERASELHRTLRVE